MKRYVSNSRIDDGAILESMLTDVIEEIEHLGYDMIVSLDDSNIPEIRLAAQSDFSKMPTILVTSYLQDSNVDNSVEFEVTMTFPELSSKNLGGSDEFEDWTEKWSDAAKVAKLVQDIDYSVDDFIHYKNSLLSDHK